MTEDELKSKLFAHEILITQLAVLAMKSGGLPPDELANALMASVDHILLKRRETGMAEHIIDRTRQNAEAILSSASVSAKLIL